MDSVSLGPVKGLRIAVAAFLLSVVLFLGGIAGAGYLLNARSDDAARFASELRNGLVKSCEQNGNPLRRAVQRMLHEQIRSSEQTPATYFPNIPPAVFKMLVKRQIKADRETIHQIAPVSCSSLYPKP